MTADYTGTEIAIVGMAGRFPGAPDVDALWTRVARGDDCLDDLDYDTLRGADRGARRRALRAPRRSPR
jgi:phthiocerol/phenolphthiocerol synthesis type-I polyketide synthase E